MVTTSAKVRHYRDLDVWQVAIELVVAVYELTKRFGVEERYGLTSQMRRSAMSVPSNVAEGHARSHTGEYLHHLSIANGSLKELETELIIAQRVGCASVDEATPVRDLAARVGQMLARLIQRLQARTRSQKSGPRSPNPGPR